MQLCFVSQSFLVRVVVPDLDLVLLVAMRAHEVLLILAPQQCADLRIGLLLQKLLSCVRIPDSDRSVFGATSRCQ